ncbi:MAG: cyclomaltodextrinase C-terminal domain-containing protein, partial [Chryseobacterium sp.]|nr:cyclomaltodextrinase C-terminal domain-containing protein [Chryseobacterium sp.]
LNWRKGKEVIHSGKTKNYVPQDGVFVYFRYDDKDKVMVIINNNEKDQTLDLKRFAESLGNVTKGKDIISEKEFSIEKNLTVPSKTPMVIELQN